jgi:hypothetical protein
LQNTLSLAIQLGLGALSLRRCESLSCHLKSFQHPTLRMCHPRNPTSDGSPIICFPSAFENLRRDKMFGALVIFVFFVAKSLPTTGNAARTPSFPPGCRSRWNSTLHITVYLLAIRWSVIAEHAYTCPPQEENAPSGRVPPCFAVIKSPVRRRFCGE